MLSVTVLASFECHIGLQDHDDDNDEGGMYSNSGRSSKSVGPGNTVRIRLQPVLSDPYPLCNAGIQVRTQEESQCTVSCACLCVPFVCLQRGTPCNNDKLDCARNAAQRKRTNSTQKSQLSAWFSCHWAFTMQGFRWYVESMLMDKWGNLGQELLSESSAGRLKQLPVAQRRRLDTNRLELSNLGGVLSVSLPAR